MLDRLAFLRSALFALPFLGFVAGPGNAAGDLKEARALNRRGEELIEQGKIQEALELFTKMAEECGSRKYCKAVAMFYIGRCCIEVGDYDLALKHLDKAEAVFTRLRKENQKAIVVQAKARAYAERSQYRKALALYYSAAEVFSRQKNKDSLFELLNSTGAIHAYLGLSDLSLRCLNLSERLLPPQPPPQKLAMLSNNTGLAELSRQDYDKAMDLFQKAYAHYQETGNVKGMATSMSNIGFVHEARAEYTQALEATRKALDMARQVTYRRQEAVALNNLGMIHLKTADYGAALKYYEESLGLSESLQVKQTAGETLNNTGMLRIVMGEYPKAEEHLRRSYLISTAVGALTAQAWALHNLAFIFKDQGALTEALNASGRAVLLADKAKDRRLKAALVLRRGNLMEYKGLFDEAMGDFSLADKLQQEIGDRFFRAITLTHVGNMRTRRGDFDAADKCFEEALQIRRSIGASTSGVLCKHALSLIERGQYRPETAPGGAPAAPESRKGELVRARDLIAEAKKRGRAENAHETWLLMYAEGRYQLDPDPKQAAEHFIRMKSHASSGRAGRYFFIAAVGLGIALEKLKNLADAERAFSEAVDYCGKIQKTLTPEERPAFLLGEQILGLKNQAAYDGLARVRAARDNA
jgi:tetratricopeptide (TPR) repeat protein